MDAFLARLRGFRVRRRELWLTNASGYRIHAHLHEPPGEEPRPAVVLVPGGGLSGEIFCTRRTLLSADELALQGIRTLHFDPVGRGQSWGHDDFCGLEGQDSLRAALDFVHSLRSVDRDRVGLISFSSGLCLAAPVLAREGARLGTRFLIDWEGPASRHEVLRAGPLPPAARTAMAADSEAFWALREPIAWIDRLPCHYLRIQSRDENSLGLGGQQSALKLVAEATRGVALSTRLGDNDADTAWRQEQSDSLRWAEHDTASLNGILVRAALDLTGLRNGDEHVGSD
jgi:pimeloyl-ACP methyl ester carboxylesterase